MEPCAAPSPDPRSPVPPSPRVAAFLQAQRDALLAEWTHAVRALAPDLPRPRLVDHIPELLDEMAAVAQGAARDGAPERQHALSRLEDGFDLEPVVAEYSALRICLLRHFPEEMGLPERLLVNVLIDQAIAQAVASYSMTRARTLTALDRISSAGLEGPDLPTLLKRLLQVFLDTTPAVEAVAVLLWDGERLRVRAAVGLEREVEQGFSLGLGEGFAGTVAARREPLELESACTDPLVRSQAIRDSGVQALYGVPLLQGEQLIGVAHIGSRTARHFSLEDKLLFRTLASRAAALVYQAQLLEREREARARLEEELSRGREREQQLQRTGEFREHLMGIVGHDLRNPLTAIHLGANALLRAADLPPRLQRTVRRILGSSERMARMVDELLDFTRSRLGEGIPITPQRTDMAAVCEGVIEELELNRPAAQLRLLCTGDTAGWWDPVRVGQVVANLAGNALRHGDPEQPVTVSVSGEDADVLLQVHNQGAPIPAALLPHLFEPFRQGQAGGRQREGLGLGLYIVDQIVRAHGGAVSVESAPGAGTTFTVRWPRRAGTQ